MGVFSSKAMSSEKANLVKDYIHSDTVVIFSKTYCPYCKMAKEVGISFNFDDARLLRFDRRRFSTK